MALIKWKDLPDTSTPLNAENLNNNFNEVLNLIYPIGRVIIDETDNDYSNYLGFTWEKTLVGVVPVGKDASQTEFDTLGETGGEKKHKLTKEELPVIKPTINYGGNAVGIKGAVPGGRENLGPNGSFIQPFGGDQAHNNLQPYQVVNYWKRVA